MSLPLNEAERYLSAHIADMQRLAHRSGVPRFSMFLNEREAQVARYAVKGELCFYGGYNGAMRTVCGVLEQTYAEELSPEGIFPVRAVTFTYRKSDILTHRDFLGALMSLEIKRELVGDILTAEGCTVVFVHETAEQLVLRIDKIGRVGVTAESGITVMLPEQKMQRIDAAVSSLRLDCVVSASANVSRERSAELIKSGAVNVNHAPYTSVSACVGENAVISIRGSGRYRVASINGETRKGKLRVTIEKYI